MTRHGEVCWHKTLERHRCASRHEETPCFKLPSCLIEIMLTFKACPSGTASADGPQIVNPSRTSVPFWGQTTQISSSLSPKRDCGSKGLQQEFYYGDSVTPVSLLCLRSLGGVAPYPATALRRLWRFVPHFTQDGTLPDCLR